MNDKTLKVTNYCQIGRNRTQKHSSHEQHKFQPNNHIWQWNNQRNKQSLWWQTQPLTQAAYIKLVQLKMTRLWQWKTQSIT